jgi:hypothetical protein
MPIISALGRLRQRILSLRPAKSEINKEEQKPFRNEKQLVPGTQDVFHVATEADVALTETQRILANAGCSGQHSFQLPCDPHCLVKVHLGRKVLSCWILCGLVCMVFCAVDIKESTVKVFSCDFINISSEGLGYFAGTVSAFDAM